MNFTKVTLLLLILALTYLAVVESRSQRKGRQNGRFKLFKSRLNRRLPDENLQYRESYNTRDRFRDNADKDTDKDNIDADYEDIDDDLNNLDLDDSNRIFFINKGQTTTTTAAPTTTPTTPTTAVTTPPDAVPPAGPPTPPPPPAATARDFDKPYKYRDYDF